MKKLTLFQIMGNSPSVLYCPEIKQLAIDFGYSLTISGTDCCPPTNADPGVICDRYGSSVSQVIGLKWIPTSKLLEGNFNNRNWKNLTDLKTIDMSNQNLSGTLPSFFTDNRILTHVNIQGNRITGNFSSFPSNLITGNFSNNLLSGTIPYIEDSTTSLDLSNNRFIGFYPVMGGGIVTLRIANNNLTGSIGSFPNSLTTLYANNNSFTSSITSFGNVRMLDVSCNLLSGAVPDVPTGFKLLKLQNNKFTSVGALLTTMTEDNCDISNNPLFSWSVPSWNGKCLMNILIESTISPPITSLPATETNNRSTIASQLYTTDTSWDTVAPLLSISILESIEISKYYQQSGVAVSSTVTVRGIRTTSKLTKSKYLNPAFVPIYNAYTTVNVILGVLRVFIGFVILSIVIKKTPFKRALVFKMRKKMDS